MAKKDKQVIIQSTTTRITLSVNGNPVMFTFVGNPSAEYMEAARKMAEGVENEKSDAANAIAALRSVKDKADNVERKPENLSVIKALINEQNYIIDYFNEKLSLVGAKLSVKHDYLIAW